MRWSHGHSMGAGGLLALAFVSGHLLWSLTAVFVLGLVLGRLWGSLGGMVRWLRDGVSPMSPSQWRVLRRRVQVLRPDDRVPF